MSYFMYDDSKTILIIKASLLQKFYKPRRKYIRIELSIVLKFVSDLTTLWLQAIL